MAPVAEVGALLGGLEGLGQQVGSHFLLPPAGERPPLLGERRGAAERGARGPGAAELAHLHGILRRRQLYCRTGFHLQILPDGSVQGTRQDHSLFGRCPRPPRPAPPSPRAQGARPGAARGPPPPPPGPGLVLSLRLGGGACGSGCPVGRRKRGGGGVRAPPSPRGTRFPPGTSAAWGCPRTTYLAGRFLFVFCL